MTRITMAMLLFAFTMIRSGQTPAVENIMNLIEQSDANLDTLRKKLATFAVDGRVSIIDLYRAQSTLRQQPGWIFEAVFQEELSLAGGERVIIPSTCLRTRRKGPALWLLTGIHGEEPAGPNALAENLDQLLGLERRGVPLVVFPLLNPAGYQRNWRYPDAATYSKTAPGASVGDSDHLLPNEKGQPRSAAAACRQAELLTAKVLELSRDYPPLLVVDMHEDNLLREGYIYSQGKYGAHDPAARAVVKIFQENRFPILMQGTTRFDETVTAGIVSDVKDGSIDELLGASTVILNGKSVKGPSGQSILVLETSSMNARLSERKRVHAKVIQSLQSLWNTVQPKHGSGKRE